MNRKLIEKRCKQCTKLFKHRPDHPNKYCSRQCAGLARRHKVKCKQCGRLVKQSRNKYCSIKCSMKAKSDRSIRNILCDECGVIFSRHKCHIGKANFCSVECRCLNWSKRSRGMNHWSYQRVGTLIVKQDRSGRKRWWVKTCHPDTWEQRARNIWTMLRGRIFDGNVIHHINRNTEDDRIHNLKHVTRAEHINLHRKELNAGKRL